MAVYEVTGPNGELYEIEGPDDADPSAVVAQLTGGQPAAPAAPQGAAEPEFRNPWRDIPSGLVGLGEMALQGATALPAKAVGGLGALATGAMDYLLPEDLDEAQTARNLQAQLTYQPQSEGAQMLGEGLARGVDALTPDFARDIPGAVEEATGGPGVNVAAGALGEAFADLAPVGAIARPVARAIGRIGAPRPTPKPEGPQINPGIERARRAGYKARPTDVQAASPGADVQGLKRERLNDPADLSRDLAQENQLRTNQLAAEEFGLPEGTLFDDATFDSLKQPHFDVYEAAEEAIRASNPLPAFESAVRKAVQRAKPRAGTSTSITQLMSTLRRRASKNIKADDVQTQRSGHADQNAADALEEAFGKQLEEAGAGDMLGSYRDSRKALAKIRNVEDSSRAGFVDAHALLKMQQRGAPLTGRLLMIAEAAEHIPSVTKHTLKTASRGQDRIGDTLTSNVKDAARKTLQLIPGLNVRRGSFQDRFGREATDVEQTYFDEYGVEPEFAAVGQPVSGLLPRRGDVPINLGDELASLGAAEGAARHPGRARPAESPELLALPAPGQTSSGLPAVYDPAVGVGTTEHALAAYLEALGISPTRTRRP